MPTVNKQSAAACYSFNSYRNDDVPYEFERVIMQQFITDRLPEIEALCRTHHVQQMSVFGSAVRDDFNVETSDVDVRVIFDSGKIERYARNAFAFQDALVALFGRKVDMLSGKAIRNPYLREAIECNQVTLYAA